MSCCYFKKSLLQFYDVLNAINYCMTHFDMFFFMFFNLISLSWEFFFLFIYFIFSLTNNKRIDNFDYKNDETIKTVKFIVLVNKKK